MKGTIGGVSNVSLPSDLRAPDVDTVDLGRHSRSQYGTTVPGFGTQIQQDSDHPDNTDAPGPTREVKGGA